MRKLFVTVVTVAAVSLVSANAQDAARRLPAPPKPKTTEVAPVKAKPVEKPGTTPAEPRRSIIDRIFGPKAKPTPPPAPPTPTPAPKVRPKRPKSRPAESTEKPAAEVEPKPNPASEKPGEESTPPTPKPEGTDANTENTPPAPEGTQPNPDAKTPEAGAAKTVGKKGSKKPAKPEAPALDDATKYKNAKATAGEDAAIKELKAKAENAVQESEAHEASVAYNRALFRKVRQIDPSLDKYVDGVEAAMMKRLNAEKKAE